MKNRYARGLGRSEPPSRHQHDEAVASQIDVVIDDIIDNNQPKTIDNQM